MEEQEQRKKRIREELKKKGFKLAQDLAFKDASGLLQCIVEDEQGKKFNLEISGKLGLENCIFTLLASDDPEDKIGEVKSGRLADVPNITEHTGMTETVRSQTDSGYTPAKRDIEEEEETTLQPEIPKFAQGAGIELTIPQTTQRGKQPGKKRRLRGVEGSKLRETGSVPHAQTTQQATTQQPAQGAQQPQQEESVRQQKEERMKRQRAAQAQGLAGAQPGTQKSKKPEGPNIAGRSLKWAAGITGATLGGAITHVLFFS